MISKEELEKLYQTHKTTELSTKLGISRTTLSRLLDKYKIRKISKKERTSLKEMEIPKEKMKKLIKEGKTIKEISEEFNLSWDRVNYIGKKYTLKIKRRFKPRKYKDTILDLYDKEFSCGEIATKLNLSESQIRKALTKWGVKLRKKWDRKKTELSEETMTLLEKYVKEGKSLQEMADSIDSTRDIVHKRLLEKGITSVAYKNKQSAPERELFNLISEHTNVLPSVRNIIPPKEIDLYLPEYNLAIEYCGLYWHSEIVKPNRNYHLNKMVLLKEKGIRLLTIFEDEWEFKKDVVISKINSILGVNTRKIFARKTEIREIPKEKANKFCRENHLQGSGQTKVAYGLFFEEELISVMTFSKISLSKTKNKDHINDQIWELNRFCNKIGYQVVGGASRLLKYFQTSNNWEKIISYADLRWSEGNLYNKLGFKYSHTSKPNYWYFYKGSKRRKHRYALRKTKECPEGLTEWQWRKSQDWNRIWDCGNQCWIMENKKAE